MCQNGGERGQFFIKMAEFVSSGHYVKNGDYGTISHEIYRFECLKVE
jgi:hypothetical protein